MSLNSSDLEDLWGSITWSFGTSHNYRRVDEVSKAELCAGINESGNRCLILELPHQHGLDLNDVIKKNLSLILLRQQSILILELRSTSFESIFCDLAISIYNKIYAVDDDAITAEIFIKTFYEWSQFFVSDDSSRLSDEEVKGFFGELLVLKRFVNEAKSHEINKCLTAWQGPYDKGKDFQFDGLDIEVKTKNTSISKVKISSEYQLDPSLGKKLQLWVVSVQRVGSKGLTLRSLIDEVWGVIILRMGDTGIFRAALSQKGLSPENAHKYDGIRYEPNSLGVYSCDDENFPSLTASNLAPALSNIKYSLNLSGIEGYLISEEKFDGY